MVGGVLVVPPVGWCWCGPGGVCYPVMWESVLVIGFWWRCGRDVFVGWGPGGVPLCCGVVSRGCGGGSWLRQVGHIIIFFPRIILLVVIKLIYYQKLCSGEESWFGLWGVLSVLCYQKFCPKDTDLWF